MKRAVWIVVALGAGLAGGFWFGRRPTEPASMKERPPVVTRPAAEPEKQIIVSIPAETLGRLKIGYGVVTHGAASAEIRVPGTVAPNGYREVRVTSLVGGVATKIAAELGQRVRRGQALAQLFSRDLAEAQTMLVGFEAQLEVEHKKLMRTEELVRIGAASREELEAVQAGHEVHAAHVEEARQRLELLGLTKAQIHEVSTGRRVSSDIAVPAPIDGVVLARYLNLGQVVTTAQELFTITDLSSVWVEGNVLEDDFGVVKVGSFATITTPAYPGRTYRGKVEYIDPRVDPETRTAKARVVVDNPNEALRLGMYVDLSFAAPGSSGLMAPAAAVQMVGPDAVVYLPVEGEAGRFREQRIQLGADSGASRLILEGVRAGERVVTEGSFLLRAEALRQHPR